MFGPFRNVQQLLPPKKPSFRKFQFRSKDFKERPFLPSFPRERFIEHSSLYISAPFRCKMNIKKKWVKMQFNVWRRSSSSSIVNWKWLPWPFFGPPFWLLFSFLRPFSDSLDLEKVNSIWVRPITVLGGSYTNHSRVQKRLDLTDDSATT